ncbi:MAG: xylulokinase [Actinobacteria bacterium]|nr:xylulokinase [Actinomycetota bacterium]
MDFVIGLDISTTAAKALVLDRSGAVRATGSSEYPCDTPHPLWSEQDPGQWWTGAGAAINAALADAGIEGSDVAAVGLAGQMHGLVLLGEGGRILRPAILWNDQRTEAECDEIRDIVGKERLIAVTGNNALTGFTAPKLLWVKRHEPEVWAQARNVLLPKDYVRYRLTGDFAIDCADGSGTLLFELARRDWSIEIVGELGIDPAWLPKVHEGPDVTGVVTPEAAEATGLLAGTPVVAGGGDQAAAAVGTGAVSPGILSVSLGTSGVVFATTEGALIEPDGRLHAFCHAVPERWHAMGVMLSAAGSLRWYHDTLASELDYSDLVDEAAAIAPGSDGLLFLPYLTGERTPHPDPLARGAFVGLTINHTRGHMTRSVMEGVAFGLRDSLALMDEVGLARSNEVRVTGGGSRSALWRQILADVMATTVVTTSTSEGVAQGSAMLASVGAGWFPTVEDVCDRFIETGEALDPSSAAETYAEAYQSYRELYPALAPTFHAGTTKD